MIPELSTELKNDLVCIFNELSEVLSDFDDLIPEQIIGLLPTIKKRISDAQYYAGKYLKDTDVLEEL